MTLPGLISKALQTRFGDRSLRYASPLDSWVIEQSTDPACPPFIPLSCPASCGASSTPRPLGSSTEVSGMLDRPVEPGDDSTNGER
ncbi:hypothetical protein [Bradyrhizobium acaciae]|uniref:hypothetical protein n=1 Tax=Bradyrhizobium acaciae TaxID=2683706 RepID=UPI001E2A5D42|nr:hypothetical protein [Bradyrhizobium acaciae]MCC8982023.1 hypothetical protein [Bradyrhizobium acaciae]